jgi:hypothetical protein
MPIVSKKDLPRQKYNKRPKTIKEHTGEVTELLIKVKARNKSGEKVYSAKVPTVHALMCEFLRINPKRVIAIGWRLSNGNEVWK